MAIHLRRLYLIFAALPALSLSMAACGSSSSPSDSGRDGASDIHDMGKTDANGDASGGGAGGRGGAGSGGVGGSGGVAGTGGVGGSGGVAGTAVAGNDGGAGSGGAGGGPAFDGGAGLGGTGGMGGASGAGQGGDIGIDGGPSDGSTDAAVGPGAPTNLVATVLDRRKTSFQLSWTAPATAAGAKVTGYQVRRAKAPITSENFDDASVTTAVAYTGLPAAVSTTDGLSVSDLYMENGYYFAVAAVDAAGNRSALTATTSAVAAHFNQTQIPAPGATNQRFGISVSADGDVNGDGLSDIVAGTSQFGRAYLFFGSRALVGGAPAVTFSAANVGFGATVAQIGDVDNDGLPDIAIADSSVAVEKIYIYKGRTTWPMTLTEAQADYEISADPTYGLFGSSMARLGDFTGDGVDDFAIGVREFNASIGRVVIIPGKATGFASIALPDATKSIVIDGDASIGKPSLGYRVLGLGHFYSVSTGTTLVVSGTTGATSVPPSAGHTYAFHGQTGTGGVISIGSADNILSGQSGSARIGFALTNLGTMLNGFPGVGVGAIQDTADVAGASGVAYLTAGTPMGTGGPFANLLLAYLTGATNTGAIVIGGGISGRDGSLSLIGSATPDLVLGGQQGPTMVIADGAKLASKTSPLDLGSAAEVKITLPDPWQSAEGSGNIIPDINGDGVPDFCVGSGTNPGAVLVFW